MQTGPAVVVRPENTGFGSELIVGATEESKLTVELCKDKNRCHFALYLVKQVLYAIMQHTSDMQ